MKYNKVFEAYKLNETKVDNILDLEKQLPKVFGIEEYLKAYDDYSANFQSSMSLYKEILKIAPNVDIKSLMLPKSKFKSEYQINADKYSELLDDDPEYMLRMTSSVLGDKAYKKYANAIIKAAGKLQAAKNVLYLSYSKASDPYDRWLIMDKYFKPRLTSLWHDKDDVYYIKGVGSFGTAMRTKRDSDLKRYINKIGDKIK